MLSGVENLMVVLFTTGCALLLMVVVNRFWRPEKRSAHNDLIGWQLGILGTTYAVMLGFMLYTVWTNYGAADLNADFEANSLVNVYRLAEGLPREQQVALQRLTQSYAEVVIKKDWPEMAADGMPRESQAVNADMWKTLMSVKAASPTEITAEDHALSELGEMTQHRRTRLLQSASRLPSVLWSVLILGGAVTIASATLFGSSNVSLHAVQVFAFSLLIALVLVAIADIDRPFQGSVHVSTYAFERAQQSMAGLP